MRIWISNMSSGQEARALIEEEARKLGFDGFGVTSADLDNQVGEGLREFIAHGHHGSMDWLANRVHHRESPKNLWHEAQSVIMLSLNYGPKSDPRNLLSETDLGNISVYARGKDYHDLIKKRLKALARFMVSEFDCNLKVFVDTAPVPEKPLASRAGLGWQGKHTNMVSSEFGSWLFLGAIYTDMQLVPDTPHRDQCGSCNACMTACPTDAFPEPYKLDARRCISYLTIEHKGPIPEEFREAMGNRIYGCDDCLAACPWNKFAAISKEAAFHARVELDAPPLSDLLSLDDETFRQVFSGSPIKRIGRNRFVRNALIAAGNSGTPNLLAQVSFLKDDPDPVVAEAACWAEAQLKASS